jgi:hypothetical protein
MLHHESIIPFHGVVYDDRGNPKHIVTKLATGGSLLNFLADKVGGITLLEILDIAIDVLGGCIPDSTQLLSKPHVALSFGDIQIPCV